jgi:hypothetical protein
MMRTNEFSGVRSGVATLLLMATAALTGWFLAGCADETAGNTSETTNGLAIVDGVAYGANGGRAAGCKVLLVENGEWVARVVSGRSVVLDSTVTDSTGAFRFETYAADANLQLERGDEALLVRSVTRPDSTHYLTARMVAAGALAGSVEATDSSLATAVRLSGTSYVSVPGAAVGFVQRFAFAKVAPGSYTAVADLERVAGDSTGVGDSAVVAEAGSVNVASGGAQDSLALQVAALQVVVDDFEDAEGRTTLGSAIGSGWWFYGSDALSGAGFAPLTGAEAWSGTGLRGSFAMGSDALSWAMVGVFFGDQLPYDLSGLQAVSFRVKGNGNYELSLYSEALAGIAGNTAHFVAYFDATPVWTRVRVPIDSFALDANSLPAQQGLGWATAARTLSAVRFILYPTGNPAGNYTLDLDDLRLEGVTLDRFATPGP